MQRRSSSVTVDLDLQTTAATTATTAAAAAAATEATTTALSTTDNYFVNVHNYWCE